MDKVQKTEDEWKNALSPEEYNVLRDKGTEAAFTGKYWNMPASPNRGEHEDGKYHCKACGAALFSSDTKFDSGTGWPSFYDLMNNDAVELKEDVSFGIKRTEVNCAKCGSHLGHLFDDLPRRSESKAGGPKPTGKRYCINSCSLDFKKKEV